MPLIPKFVVLLQPKVYQSCTIRSGLYRPNVVCWLSGGISFSSLSTSSKGSNHRYSNSQYGL